MTNPEASLTPEPVTAEIVPPPPSPWRFGLRAMFGLTAVCSVQFALMNYVGVLQGLLLGVFICAASFGFLVLVGMILSGKSAQLLPTLDQLVVRLMVALVVLVIGTILAGGGTAAFSALRGRWTESRVERNLGLSLSREMCTLNNQVVWGLAITSVQTGGLADRAGLRKGEVIMLTGTIDEFFEFIMKNRGKDVDLNVASGVVAGSLDNTTRSSVTLSIPK